MKRRIVIGVFIILSLVLLGCSQNTEHHELASATVEPTVTEASTPIPTPSPEPTPTPTPTPIPSSWEVDNYVDDFGDKTGSAYLRGTFKGKFSNSATSGSSLTVHFYYESAYCSIRLLEYDSHKATFTTNDDVILKFKVDDKEYSIDLVVLSYGDDLYFTSSFSGYSVLKNALMDGKEIKCVVKGTKYGETYNFTMDGIGFKEALEEAGMH